MLPAAGLPIRLRPGLSRRRSSACAAARPGPPAGHRTRRAEASPAIASTVSRRGWRRPHRTPRPSVYEGKDVQGVRRSLAGRGCFRPGGSRRLGMPSLRNRSLCCRRMFFATSARVGASVPRPHATSPKPAAPAHAARARCRRPAAQCPAPTAAWVTTGATAGHPFEHPRGPGPVQKGHKGQPQLQPGPAVITSHPGIVAQAARVCQAPGLPPPGRCRPAGPGRRRCSGPAASALAPRRSSAQPGSPGRAAGPVSPPAPPCGSTPHRGLKLEPW